MPEAYIVEAVRTAGGSRNGALKGVHPAGKCYGLQTMCEGGGIANVTIVEAL